MVVIRYFVSAWRITTSSLGFSSEKWSQNAPFVQSGILRPPHGTTPRHLPNGPPHVPPPLAPPPAPPPGTPPRALPSGPPRRSSDRDGPPHGTTPRDHPTGPPHGTTPRDHPMGPPHGTSPQSGMSRARGSYLVFATIFCRLHHKRRRHGNHDRGEHVGHAEGPGPDQVHAEAEDEDRADRREVGECRGGHERL